MPQNIIALEKVIKDIQQRLGSHLKAKGDLSGLLAKKKQLLSDAGALLRDIRPELAIDDAESIRISSPRRKQINELSSQHGTLEERQKSAAKQITAMKEKIDQTNAGIGALGTTMDIKELRELHEVIQKQGDIEKRLKETKREFQVLNEQAAKELSKLPLWNKDIAALEILPIPKQETLDRFERDLDEQKLKLERIKIAINTAEGKIRKLKANLTTLEVSGEIPTEGDLQDARTHRQEGWKLIRKAWIEKVTVDDEASAFDPLSPLDIAYEESIEKADEISDRLRQEADRVAQKMNWLAELRHHEEELEGYRAEDATLKQEMVAINEQWKKLWLPLLEVGPLPPKEMRVWVTNQQSLVHLSERVRNAGLSVTSIEGEIAGYKNNLFSVLNAIGKTGYDKEQPLAVLLNTADKIIKSHDNTETQREFLKENIRDLQTQLAGATSDQKNADSQIMQWKSEWAQVLQDIGLDASMGLSSVSDHIEKVQELFEKIDEAEKISDRIRGIEEDSNRFSGDVKTIIETAAPDLSTVTVEHAASALGERLEEARRNEIKQKALHKQIKEKEGDFQQADNVIRENILILDRLKDEARCTSYEEFEDIEKKSGETRSLDNEILQFEKQLMAYVAGGTIADLIDETAGLNPDELPLRIEQMELEINDLKNQVSALDQAIGGEEKEIEKMDGGSRTAEASEKAQSALAQLREGVERYVLFKLASEILRDEIEKYRSQHQGPILKRASEIFSTITVGSFSGLKTGYNSDDRPILLGVRPDGRETGVEGMSDGTSDQLFLSLRLASLERQLGAGEPLPFIVDDILVNFDDDRATATLKILATLSHKTQIIFFTHHQHLVELARQAIAPGIINIHNL